MAEYIINIPKYDTFVNSTGNRYTFIVTDPIEKNFCQRRIIPYKKMKKKLKKENIILKNILNDILKENLIYGFVPYKGEYIKVSDAIKKTLEDIENENYGGY